MYHLALLFDIAIIWQCYQITISDDIMSNDTDYSTCFNRSYLTTGYQTVTTICFGVNINSGSYTWADAENRCQRNNGSGGNDCWIGLIGCTGNDMTWIDGERFSYKHWNGGEPNGEDECCTEMYGGSVNAASCWNDISCTSKFKCYICGRVTNVEIITTTAQATPPISTTSSTSTTIHLNTTPVKLTTSSKINDTPAGDKLVSPSGDIALIALASIFFLTTFCLTLVLVIIKWKQVRSMRSVEHCVSSSVETDGYNLQPPLLIDAMYYDTQNETIEAQSTIVNKSISHGISQDVPTISTNEMGQRNQVIEINFANNEIYN